MQAYSLSRRLTRDFPDAEIEIIDYNPRAREFFKFKCPLVFTYRRGIGAAIKKAVQTRVFNKFVSANLPVGKRLLGVSDDRLYKYIGTRYDVVVVGSDAVFNWNDLGLPNPYFLGGISDKPKLSYAASAHLQFFGRLDPEKKEYLKEALSDFQYVGVRDESTATFVNEVTGGHMTAVHNCDPTIFLEMDFPEMSLDKKLRKAGFDPNKKTVFVMLMHPEYAAFARRYFGDDVQIVALMDSNKNANIYLHNLNPFEWAHVFSRGHFLVTDYFHGTIMALKNGIPTLSVDASKYCTEGYESKARDLLYTRLQHPYLYLNSSELSGEGGYERFARAVKEIEEKFDPDAIAAAMARESLGYNSFAEALGSVMGK